MGPAVPLKRLRDAFEGVIPSVIATLDAAGEPNVSYLSQVWMLDDQHVALSNQFFSKTAANVRQTGRATLMVVDGRTGEQFSLDLAWERSVLQGELFEQMAAQLRAISSLEGHEGVMRLKSAEIYRVLEITAIDSLASVPRRRAVEDGERLAAAARLAAEVAAEDDADLMVDRVLDGMVRDFGFANVMVLAPDGEALSALDSRGYPARGAGAEVRPGQGAIGIAAETGRAVRLSDMSRGRRFVSAVRGRASDHDIRTIALPGLAEPMSQLAVPMIAQGRMAGVLFAESAERFRFTREDQDAMGLIGAQLAASLRLAELQTAAAQPAAAGRPAAAEAAVFRVRHHGFDDSVFVDGEYLIKGVPGRLLAHFLQAYLTEGRRRFSNREIRLDASLRLPDLKDNLETRLILLRRRLEERAAPIRLTRPGRGLIEIELDGEPVLERA
jgi:hypothetical protein